MEPERIELSQRERDRLKVLQEVEKGHLTQGEAAGRLKLSDRPERSGRCWLRRVEAEGDRGVIHRLRGGPMGIVQQELYSLRKRLCPDSCRKEKGVFS